MVALTLTPGPEGVATGNAKYVCLTFLAFLCWEEGKADQTRPKQTSVQRSPEIGGKEMGSATGLALVIVQIGAMASVLQPPDLGYASGLSDSL